MRPVGNDVSAPITEKTLRAAGSASEGKPETGPSFRDVFEKLAKEVDQGEKTVKHALKGNPYDDDSRGMIALQAGVYRYVEAVELCTKLVDRSTNAVKTTLQNQ